MFYLFILESIGTPELILIGMVALIIFGPRKLPEMMKTVGKTIAEFKRSTNDFKESWEKEIDYEKGELNSFISAEERTETVNTSIGRNSSTKMDEMIMPEIKEIETERLAGNYSEEKSQSDKNKAEKIFPPESVRTNKRDWL